MAPRALLFLKVTEVKMPATTFLQLSRSRQALIRLCQRVSYGSILNVRVVCGEVVFDDPPNITVDVRLDGDIAERQELRLNDFALPAEIRRLFAQVDGLGDGNNVLAAIKIAPGSNPSLPTCQLWIHSERPGRLWRSRFR